MCVVEHTCFPQLFCLLAYFPCSLPVVTQTWVHILRLPLPATVGSLHIYRKKGSVISSLVNSRQLVPINAIISSLDKQLISVVNIYPVGRVEHLAPPLVICEVNLY